MLKMNYKKALLAATVLTAFCANAAFAGEAPDKPTMRERVDRILQHQDNCDIKETRHKNKDERFECRHPKGFKAHKMKMTKEQHEANKARREAWKKMSPEERKEAMKKWHTERKERVEAKMNKLTPEQRKEVEDFIKKDREFHKAQMEKMKKHNESQRKEMRKMTKEQREAIHAQQPPKKIGMPNPKHRDGKPLPPPPFVDK